ncbi:MAG: hypothetical protein KF817_15355 [Phycisphaeraceae bacterium]|nr:hypothetical protein [Phycisphaeraceae bacterium]
MKRLLWPGIIFIILGASVTLHVIMLAVVSGRPDLTLDMRTTAQARRTADGGTRVPRAGDHGWTVQWSVLDAPLAEPAPGAPRVHLSAVVPATIRLTVRDAEGRGVPIRIDATAHHLATPHVVRPVDFRPGAADGFIGVIDAARPGWYRISAHLSVDGHLATETIDLPIGIPAAITDGSGTEAR